MKYKFLIILGLLLPTSYATQAQNADAALRRFVNLPILQSAVVGVSIKEIAGKNVIAHNNKKSLTPASVLKVLTTATALESLGANYRYHTELSKLGDTLFVQGYGDPTLGSERTYTNPHAFLDTWAGEIGKQYDKDRAINIKVVDNYFGYSAVSRKWIREDIGNYYAAGTYGISVFDNTYRLTLNSMKKDAAPTIVSTKPYIANLQFDNQLTLNTTGKDNAFIVGEPMSNQYTLIGDMPASRPQFQIKGSIPNPGLYLGETLADVLRQSGFGTGTISNAHAHYKANMHSKAATPIIRGKVFYTHTSIPLTDIIREVNVKSNNHYSEHLIRTLGRKHNADIYSLPIDEGVDYIKDFWTKRAVNTQSLIMYDGCGLSPANGISPELLTDVLIYMQSKSTHSAAYLKSLPIAGQEGTVAYFLRGSKLAGKVYVKSGSIAGVQCYSGYYISGEKKYAFTIMVNKYTCQRQQVVKAISQLLLDVF